MRRGRVTRSPQRVIAYTYTSNRKQWRRDHPFGFFAKPMRNSQGLMDLKKWDCGVPGKEKTIWEGGLFKLEVTFPDGTTPPSLTINFRTPTVFEIHFTYLTEVSQSTRRSRRSANSSHRYSTRTSIPLVPSACLFSTRKKAGSPRSRSKRFCWASSHYSTSRTLSRLLKRMRSTSSRRIEPHTRRR